MSSWILALVVIAAAVLTVIFLLSLKTNEKRIRERVISFCATAEPAFERTIAGIFGPQYAGGNAISTYVNGVEIFPAMLAAIDRAEKSINFETFIYWSGEIGRKFADAFVAKARAGVEVNILLDWAGSQRMDQSLLSEMEEAGAVLHRFHPPTWTQLPRFNNRTHRKLLIVDGKVGFTGGVGIADEWLGDADRPGRRRDNHYKIEGPAVAQMQGVFLDNWLKAAGRLLHGEAYFPPLEKAGDLSAQVVASSPSGGWESMHLLVQIALASAREEVIIVTPYFVPDDMTMEALIAAVRRGAEVTVMLGGRQLEPWVARRASQGLWDHLLENGVRILEYRGAKLHWKLLLVDRRWTSIGSMNFDNRSFRLNDEANLNILDAAFAAEQYALFEKDLERCERIEPLRWKRRPMVQRAYELVSLLVRDQM